jgi:hypothetical protein
MPSIFQSLMQDIGDGDMTEGVGPQYAVLSIRGKVFRVKYNGAEEIITIDHQGQRFAAPAFDVVILNASAARAKTYYKSGFVEGAADAPDCWSEDGVTPLAPLANRPLVEGRPCLDCRLCPMNAFGSKPKGPNDVEASNAKACADTRKIAIVPLDDNQNVDVGNARFGGPMLLRIPADSLKTLAEYSKKLQNVGYPYCAIVTRITFDQQVAYPKLAFQAVRAVTEAEAAQILAARNQPNVLEILHGAHSSAPQTQPQLAGPSPIPMDAVQQQPVLAAPVNVPANTIPQAVPLAPPAPATAAPFVPPAAPAPQTFVAPQQPAPQTFVPPAAPSVPTAPAPAPAFSVPAAAAPVTAAPFVPPATVLPTQSAAVPVNVSADLLSRVDSLLGRPG